MVKYFYVFLFSILTVFSSVAQRTYGAFDVLQNKTVVPPNGILFNDTLFMDDSEVSNLSYMEYLHFLAQDSSDAAIIAAYPDTSLFGTKHLKILLSHSKDYYKKKGNKHVPISEPLHDEVVHEPSRAHHWWNYFSYHGTKHHPVVGISYAQALAYMKWRSNFITGFFNESLSAKKKYSVFEGKKVTFEFRLPTEQEWETVASVGQNPLIYPYGAPDILEKPAPPILLTKKNKHRKAEIDHYNQSDSLLIFNVHDRERPEVHRDKHEPESTFNNYPNKWGFYNLIGNVAEMVAEQGKSKGGSYMHNLDDCQIKKSIPYTASARWLGFRCVCKVTLVPR